MNLRWSAVLLACVGLACLEGRAADKDEKGAVIKLGSVSSRAPADWKEEKNVGAMRLTQLTVPKVEGDDTDAEVVIYKLGGSTKDNVARWKNQFTPPEGKKIDDVAKVTEMKVGNVDVTHCDVRGTYNAPPFDPKYKGKKMANFRLVGVIFDSKDGPFQIRFIGPEKTVEKHKKAFDEWVKAFK